MENQKDYFHLRGSHKTIAAEKEVTRLLAKLKKSHDGIIIIK